MKIVAITHGSTGDTLPPAVLLKELYRRGHEVLLLAAPAFQNLAEEFSVPLLPIPPWGDEDVMAEAMRSISGYRQKHILLAKMYELIGRGAAEVEELLSTALDGADLLIVNSIFPFWTEVARRRSIKTVSLHFCHDPLPSIVRAPHLVPLPPSFLGPVRRLCAKAVWRAADHFLCRLTTRALRRSGAPPSLLPVRDFIYRPADFALITVPPEVFADPGLDLRVPSAYCGYLRRPPTNPPPSWADQLEEFCQGQKLPLIAFGSMRTDTIQSDLARLLAAKPSGQRCLLIKGWGSLPPQLDRNEIFVLPPTPHEWVLPYASAFLHHGGAGTTAAALVAGVPQLIRPFFADQPFWAAEITNLGCGLTAPSFKRPAAIWERLHRVAQQPEFARKASAIAVQLPTVAASVTAADQILSWLNPSGGSVPR